MYKPVEGGIVRMDRKLMIGGLKKSSCVQKVKRKCIDTGPNAKGDVSMQRMRRMSDGGYTQNAAERNFYGEIKDSLCGTSAVRGRKRNVSAGSNGTG